MRKFFYSIINKQRKDFSYFLFNPLLLALSFFYAAVAAIAKFLYKIGVLRSKKATSKVISIGNITWGGTGKTSLAIYLAKFLKDKGMKPAVLIRGYGNDENAMLKQMLSNVAVLSGRNRIKNAKLAHDKHNADVLILDDGFQHWCLKRDLDIVAISATNPFGNRQLIPAGILREPVSALGRADLIVITKVNLAAKENINSIKSSVSTISKAEVFEAEYLPVSVTNTKDDQVHGLDYIKKGKLCAVSGVGDNNSFFKMLENLDVQIQKKFSYMDHQKYTDADLKNIFETARNTGSDGIITTHKDWIRLKRNIRGQTPDIALLLLNANMRIIDEKGFQGRISSLLSS